MNVTWLIGSKCFESQQCDFEMNAGSNMEPLLVVGWIGARVVPGVLQAHHYWLN